MPEPTSETDNETSESRVKAGPAARKTATELGVDLGGVSGTDPGGRVRSDVESSVPKMAATNLKGHRILSMAKSSH